MTNNVGLTFSMYHDTLPRFTITIEQYKIELVALNTYDSRTLLQRQWGILGVFQLTRCDLKERSD